MVTYGIDEGKTSLISRPVYGHSGFVRYGYGRGHHGIGIRHSYHVPVYSVVGTSTHSVTNYTKAIAMDIVETKSFATEEEPRKLYEGRTRSTGRCSVVVEVFDEMLEAMFTNFTGQNAQNRTLTIEGNVNC